MSLLLAVGQVNQSERSGVLWLPKFTTTQRSNLRLSLWFKNQVEKHTMPPSSLMKPSFILWNCFQQSQFISPANSNPTSWVSPATSGTRSAKRKREIVLPDVISHQTADDQPVAEEIFLTKERYSLLHDVLDKLRSNCRAVLMHWANGFYGRNCRKTGLPVGRYGPQEKESMPGRAQRLPISKSTLNFNCNELLLWLAGWLHGRQALPQQQLDFEGSHGARWKIETCSGKLPLLKKNFLPP